jgi:Haemolymph juvenile hormone binding protein (JHBP)
VTEEVKIKTFFSVNDLKKCKFDDNDCLLEVANEVFSKHFAGDEDLHLKSFDPLKIDKMDIVQNGNSSVQMDFKFRRTELFGLSKAKVYKVSGFKEDPDKNILETNFKTPLGSLVGKYDISGKILILPIKGRGNVTLNFENLDIKLRFLTKKVEREGNIFMSLEKAKFSYEVTG